MNPFDRQPHAWLDSAVVIMALALLAYGGWVIWPIFELWMGVWE